MASALEVFKHNAIKGNQLKNERKIIARELYFQKYAVDKHSIVSVADLEGNITYVNDKFCDISGYSHDELLGKNHRIIKSDEHSPAFFAEMWKTISSGNVWQGSIKSTDKTGTHYWVEATIVPFMDDQEKPFQYIAIRTNISHLKGVELALNDAKLKAENANKAKSRFLSSMSHELRTPMNAILGFGQLLAMDGESLNEDQRSGVSEILSAGAHLLSLIDDVLDLAKIESGKFEITMNHVLVKDVLRSAIQMINTQAKARNIRLIDNVSNKNHVVNVDAFRLKQVMINLLTNAIKYNRESGSIILTSDIVNNQCLRISVTDTGDGLTEQEIAKLFTSFERINPQTDVEGTGIGLVITKNLIELMGGLLGVESVKGDGCTFWIELALVDPRTLTVVEN